MKKPFLYTFSLALLSLMFLSFNKNRDNLVGSWKITKVEPKTAVSQTAKNDILSHGSLTFTDDGFVRGRILQDINNGTFALTKKGKSLVIKEDTGTPYNCQSIINEDELVLDTKQMTVTLTKI
ncbi:lipocalin family protein [[Flexibacter] sp. ATCC 35103]|uniref:lipocalin family protein n=1 Tax=[Flexibacter] sp. ATCC 35103 TaxID=1937528 RepID=UPI0009C7A423|nr:lipocalin family protein [[Flexibacter] sp. ATCC 35103]OMQ08949.1 hypothetical protein BXU01_18520 [[Flexibacter] sp. ATCC 35103]